MTTSKILEEKLLNEKNTIKIVQEKQENNYNKKNEIEIIIHLLVHLIVEKEASLLVMSDLLECTPSRAPSRNQPKT